MIDYNQYSKSELVKMLVERDAHEHEWSAPVVGQLPIYNDFGTPRVGVSKPIAYVSCKGCGDIKSKQ